MFHDLVYYLLTSSCIPTIMTIFPVIKFGRGTTFVYVEKYTDGINRSFQVSFSRLVLRNDIYVPTTADSYVILDNTSAVELWFRYFSDMRIATDTLRHR